MVNRLSRIILFIIISITLSGCTLGIGQKSGIQVTSSTQVEVSLNNESLGKTPIYQDKGKPGNYTLRLTPSDTTLQPWETQVSLINGVYTVVDYQFGITPDQSSYYILTYEKLTDKNRTEIVFVTTPSNTPVSIDGNPSGFSSSPITNITSGGHKISFAPAGYQEKSVGVNVIDGYRLIINTQLATQTIVPTPTPTPTATPSAELKDTTSTPTKTTTSTTNITPLPKQSTTSATLAKPYVEILDTPTGWLKVREDATVNSTELAKVNPGDRFSYRESTATGWFEIEYATGKWAFVSSQYAKLVE